MLAVSAIAEDGRVADGFAFELAGEGDGGLTATYEGLYDLVHVDYATQARTVKDSGREYARIARGTAP